MARSVDRTGETNGLLTVVAPDGHYVKPSGVRETVYLCGCECGATRRVRGSKLKGTTHCGCQRRKAAPKPPPRKRRRYLGEAHDDLEVIDDDPSIRYVSETGMSEQRGLLVLCHNCASETVMTVGNFNRNSTCGCGFVVRMSGPNNPKWKGDDVGYIGAHSRLIRSRGNATEHPCEDCLAPPGIAKEWSYEFNCPAERLGESHPGTMSPYCPVHDHCYVPRCKGDCHKVYDARMK
jgi:hypothetical protein